MAYARFSVTAAHPSWFVQVRGAGPHGVTRLHLGLFHPSTRIRVADEIEQPAHQREAIATPEAESGRVRRERVGDGAGIVERPPERVRDDVPDPGGILAIREQVRRDPRGAGDGETVQLAPLSGCDLSPMQAHIGTTGLPSDRQGELMLISGEMAEPVERCGRAAGDDPLFRSPFPRGHLRCKLQPRRAQSHVIGGGRTGQTVDAVGDPIEDGVRGQPLQRPRRQSGILSAMLPVMGITGETGAERAELGAPAGVCRRCRRWELLHPAHSLCERCVSTTPNRLEERGQQALPWAAAGRP